MMKKYSLSWNKLCLFLACFFATNSFANGQVEVEVISELSLSEPVVVKLISWHDNGYIKQKTTDIDNKVVFENVPAAQFDVFVDIESQKTTAKAHGEIVENEVTPITLVIE